MIERIAVLGAGAWGTALAHVAARPGRQVTLWCRDKTQASVIERDRQNRTRLPGFSLGAGIEARSDLDCVAGAGLVLAAVPAQSLRRVLDALPRLGADVPIVVCAKGIEVGSGLRLSEVCAQCRPEQSPAALSGPSFAADVARDRPTAVTVAAHDMALAKHLADELGRPAFRLYFTDDLRGVEIGGAAKNVLAIACGIAAGLDLGASASAALVARGFAEMARFGRSAGARPETLMGLSGLGDLVLTCASAQSRNFALGLTLAQGRPPGEALAEGAATAPVLAGLARSRAIDMPIVEAVAAILSGTLAPAEAIGRLLNRPAKAETEPDPTW